MTEKPTMTEGAVRQFPTCVQELLNIEQFFHEKFNKIKTKSFREIGAHFSHCWENTLMSKIL
jgi:hypothetical protein